MEGGFGGWKYKVGCTKKLIIKSLIQLIFLGATEYIRFVKRQSRRSGDDLYCVNCSDWVKLRYNIIIMNWLKRQGRDHLWRCGSVEKLFVCINHSQPGVLGEGIFTPRSAHVLVHKQCPDSVIKALECHKNALWTDNLRWYQIQPYVTNEKEGNICVATLPYGPVQINWWQNNLIICQLEIC